MEQRDPLTPSPEHRQPPASSKAEKGVFEKWFKRRGRKPAAVPEQPGVQPESQQSQSPETPEAQDEKTKKKRGQKILRLLGFKRATQPEAPRPQPYPETVASEPQERTEPEPVIEQAGRMRRFAKVVIEKVLGVAEREHANVRQWDGEQARPINTEPLVEAADDLRHAVHDLEAAMPETTQQEQSVAYDTSPDGPGYGAAEVSRRIEQRIQQLEEKATEQAEQNNRTAAFAVAGIGILAVATVLVAGYEYLSHKKIKKEQRSIRKELAHQQDTQKAQEAEFARLQREQTAHMARRERQAYYRDITEFTHKQAQVTREVTHELRQVAPRPQQQVALVREPAQQEAVVWQRQQAGEQLGQPVGPVLAERGNAQPDAPTAERLSPLVQTETADKVEQGPGYRAGTNDQQGGAGISGAGSQIPVEPSVDAPIPLSPAAQRQLKARQQRAQTLAANAWIYGIVLATLLIGFAIVFVLIG